MSNTYTKHSAQRCVSCTREDYQKLAEVAFENSVDRHGFEMEYHAIRGLYLMAEESGVPEELPVEFLQCLGRLLTKAGLPYLEVGYCTYNDRTTPDSCGGGAWRIYPDGSMVEAELTWPVSLNDSLAQLQTFRAALDSAKL